MSKELTINQKKEWAQMLFLKGDLTQKEIAQKTGVSERSISKWVNEGEWESLRQSLLISKEDQLRHLYALLAKISDKLKAEDSIGDTKIADMYSKYTAAIKNLETETSIAQIMEVGQQFIRWLQAIDMEFALTVGNHLDAFIKERLKRF